jgi:hypothetical protein
LQDAGDELFAYLDQLELDERIEQEKIVVDDLHPAVAEAREAQNDTTVIKCSGHLAGFHSPPTNACAAGSVFFKLVIWPRISC